MLGLPKRKDRAVLVESLRAGSMSSDEFSSNIQCRRARTSQSHRHWRDPQHRHRETSAGASTILTVEFALHRTQPRAGSGSGEGLGGNSDVLYLVLIPLKTQCWKGTQASIIILESNLTLPVGPTLTCTIHVISPAFFLAIAAHWPKSDPMTAARAWSISLGECLQILLNP